MQRSAADRRFVGRVIRRAMAGAQGADRSYVSEAVCKPSSVPPGLAAGGDGHPSGAAGRPTAHAADPRAGQRTSPPPTVARRRVAPSYLALLRVEFARFTPVAGSKPPIGIVTVALVLASRRTGVTRHPALRSSDFPHAATGSPRRDARPSDRLADRSDPTPSASGAAPAPGGRQRPVRRRAANDRRRPAGSRRGRSPRWRARRRPSSGRAARAPRSSARTRPGSAGPAVQSGISLASLTRQRPASCSTMSFESSSRWTSRAPSSRASSSARTTPGVLGHVVGLDAEVVGDRGVRDGAVVAGVRPRQVVQSAAPSDAGPGLPRAAPSVRMTKPALADGVAEGSSRSGTRSGKSVSLKRSPRHRAAGRAAGPTPAGPAARPGHREPGPPPRSLRQTHWSGS